MEVTAKDRIGYSFAEFVRQQSVSILALVETGKLQDASLALLALNAQSAKTKKELAGDEQPEAL